MIGSVDIKVRPLKLAYLIEANNSEQAREAIRLSSTLWGGIYSPIIPLYKRLPTRWRERPTQETARDIVTGYLEAFDPDVVVQLSKEIPQYIKDTHVKVITPDMIWSMLGTGPLSPIFGVGIFELLEDIYREYFKYRAKYPKSIIFPELPKQFQLFWASFLGDIPVKLYPHLEKGYYEPLEISTPLIGIENLVDMLKDHVMFPLRITSHNTRRYSSSSAHRNAWVIYLDASRLGDILDYWNLRALGRPVMPLPKQFRDSPQINELVYDFLEKNKRLWTKDPEAWLFASIIPARSCTERELQEYALMSHYFSRCLGRNTPSPMRDWK